MQTQPTDIRDNDILPSAFHRPLNLLWIAVLPLTVLFVLNAYGAWCAWKAIGVLTFSLQALLVLSLVFPLLVLSDALKLHFRKRTLRWNYGPLLVRAVVFTACNMWLLGRCMIVWENVPRWVFDNGTFYIAQFAGATPLILYALVGIACTRLPFSRVKDIAVSVGLLVVLPMAVGCIALANCVYDKFPTLRIWSYEPVHNPLSDTLIVLFLIAVGAAAMVALLRWFARFPRWPKRYDVSLLLLVVLLSLLALPMYLNNEFVVACIVVLSLIGGMAMMLASLRLLTRFFLWFKRHDFWLLFLAALWIPLIGVSLNIETISNFAFLPGFQTAGIYILLLANATVLLLACLPRLRKKMLLWLAQIFTFPFTLYFFVVLLPFLLFFLPAMLVWGAGVLILSTTALFMVHGERLVKGFRRASLKFGKPLAVAMALTAFAPIPAWLLTQALLDRTALHTAISYIRHSDPRPPIAANPQRIVRVLEKMHTLTPVGEWRDLSSPALPIWTPFYNLVVFGYLDLSVDEREHMLYIFNGKKSRPRPGTLYPNSSPSSSLSSRFPHDQISSELKTASREDDDCIRTTLTFRMTNHAKQQNEFVTTLRLSPTVMVSGLRLDINGTMEDGQIFERQTATAVYEQIRNRRQDPALVRYVGENEIELRVFPLAADETRTVEIEFLYPSNATSEVVDIASGEKLIQNSDITTRCPPPLLLTQYLNTAMLTVTPFEEDSVTRTPYHHFIVERSADTAKQTAAELLEKIRAVNAYSPMENCKITFANFESRLMTPEPIPVALLSTAQLKKMMRQFPAWGTFLEEEILREKIAAYENSKNRDNPQSFLTFPQFTIIGSDGADTMPAENTRAVIVAIDERVFIFTKQSNVFASADSELDIFSEDKFITPSNVGVVENETYQYGAAVWAVQDGIDNNTMHEKGLLPWLVAASRESGILVPATAYIVVENKADWNRLSEQERRTLAANQMHGQPSVTNFAPLAVTTSNFSAPIQSTPNMSVAASPVMLNAPAAPSAFAMSSPPSARASVEKPESIDRTRGTIQSTILPTTSNDIARVITSRPIVSNVADRAVGDEDNRFKNILETIVRFGPFEMMLFMLGTLGVLTMLATLFAMLKRKIKQRNESM